MLSSPHVTTVTTHRIIFVPGKNPKPPAAEYHEQLFRCLVHGVGRADPEAARAIERAPDLFTLIPWNVLYYGDEKPIGPDRPWIDVLLTRTGPTEDEVREALSWRRKAAWAMISIADLLPILIPLLPDPAVKSTIQETGRYFANVDGVGSRVRELLKVPLQGMMERGERVLLIGHSMGSVIAYDALWELWHAAGRRERIDRSEEHTSELQSHVNLVCRLLLEKKKQKKKSRKKLPQPHTSHPPHPAPPPL